MARLPPLIVPRKPIGMAHQTGTVKIGETAVSDVDASQEDLQKLSKDASQLLKVRPLD